MQLTTVTITTRRSDASLIVRTRFTFEGTDALAQRINAAAGDLNVASIEVDPPVLVADTAILQFPGTTWTFTPVNIEGNACFTRKTGWAARMQQCDEEPLRFSDEQASPSQAASEPISEADSEADSGVKTPTENAHPVTGHTPCSLCGKHIEGAIFRFGGEDDWRPAHRHCIVKWDEAHQRAAGITVPVATNPVPVFPITEVEDEDQARADEWAEAKRLTADNDWIVRYRTSNSHRLVGVIQGAPDGLSALPAFLEANGLKIKGEAFIETSTYSPLEGLVCARIAKRTGTFYIRQIALRKVHKLERMPAGDYLPQPVVLYPRDESTPEDWVAAHLAKGEYAEAALVAAIEGLPAPARSLNPVDHPEAFLEAQAEAARVRFESGVDDPTTAREGRTIKPQATKYARVWLNGVTFKEVAGLLDASPQDELFAALVHSHYSPHDGDSAESDKDARRMLREWNAEARRSTVKVHVLTSLIEFASENPDALEIRSAIADGYTHVVAVDNRAMWALLGAPEFGQVELYLIALKGSAPRISKRSLGDNYSTEALEVLGEHLRKMAAWGEDDYRPNEELKDWHTRSLALALAQVLEDVAR